MHEVFDQWSTEYPIPPEDHRHFQHGWDELLYEHHFWTLPLMLSKGLLIVSFLLRVSGAWLGALPVLSLGTELDNESLRIALGLCLGVPIVVKHNVFVVVKL